MKEPQEIFDQIREFKKEQKEIRKEYRQALEETDEFEEISDKIKGLRDKKKEIELRAQSRMGIRWEKLEELKEKLDEKNQMISDVAISELAEGKAIEVKDEYNNEYEPIYKVTFKKIK